MLKKSKIISSLITLAVLSIFASIVGVRAESNIDDNVYKVEGSYEVSIPATVTVDTSTDTGTLKVKGTVQPYHELGVQVKSADDSYSLKCGNHKVSYVILVDDMTDEKAGEKQFSYLAVENAKDFSKDIIVKAIGTSQATVSGEYTDTLTFTMSCQPTKEFTLTCDANGGEFKSSDVTSKQLAYGQVYGELPIPTRTNCTFKGWYKEQKFYGTTQVTTESRMEGADTTIYAHWGGIWNVTIDPNGGTLYVKDGSIVTGASEDNPIQCDSPNFRVQYDDGAYNNLLISAVREGYTSTGYFDEMSEGTKVWEATGPCVKGKKYYQDLGGSRGAVWVNSDKTESERFTFYPQWKANEYKIVYDKNADDATGTTETSSHTYDVEASLRENGFEREGYTFKGWATTADAEKYKYMDGEPVKNLTSENNATVTLYAVWEENSSDEQVDDTEIQNMQSESDTVIQDDFISDESEANVSVNEQIDGTGSDNTESDAIDFEQEMQSEPVGQKEINFADLDESDSEYTFEKDNFEESEQLAAEPVESSEQSATEAEIQEATAGE